MFALQAFIIIVALIVGVYVYLQRITFNYWLSRQVPQFDPIPVLGNLWPVLIGKLSIGELTRDAYHRFKKSPVAGIWVFHRPTLIINDIELVKFVLAKSFAHFHDRGIYCNDKVDQLNGHLFLLSGAKWRNLRARLTPSFSSGKIKQMFFTVKDCAVQLEKCVADDAKKNGLIEIKDLMARYTTDVIASIAFGIRSNSLEYPDADFRKWGRKAFEPRFPIQYAIFFLFPQMLVFLGVRTTPAQVTRFFTKAFVKMVTERKANNIVRHDFLHLVMQLMDKGYIHDGETNSTPDSDSESHVPEKRVGGKISMIEGAAQAYVFWLAGFETSSGALSNCLYDLSLHQDIQDKIVAEIKQVSDNFDGITYENLNSLSYLNRVILETLRKYPSAAMLNRICTKDVTLPGINLLVEKGTPVVIPVRGIQWDPEFYPEPEKFDPERFTEENIAKRPSYTYLPFGEGPRICIGMRFGMIQTKIAIANLLLKYKLTPGPNLQVPLQVDRSHPLTCYRGDLLLRISER